MELYGSIAVVTLKYLLLSIICLLTFIYCYVSRDYDYWKKRGVQYKKPFFCFGNLDFLMRKSATDFFYDLGKKFKGPYVGIFLGSRPALVVQDVELARKILIKDAAVFQDRHLYCGESDPLGALNLFNVKNPIWRDMRRQMAPMFASARLRDLGQTMNINVDDLMHRIQRDHVDENKPVHLKDLFCRYTTDNAVFAIFGTSALQKDNNLLWHISSNIVKWTFWRGFEFTLCFFQPAVANFLRFKFFSKSATQYVKKIYLEEIKEREGSGTVDDSDLIGLLQKMKDTGKKYSDDPEFSEQLMTAQVAVFILGAIETSSSTTSYCLHELAYHQTEQAKLYKEIDDTIRNTGKEVLEFDDTLEMPYLNSCIQETLRKYPPLPYLDRIGKEDYEIDDHLKVERGTPVLINVVGTHHNPELYEEPQKWKPDRFTGLNPDNEHRNYTFFPFGLGPRFCIGKRYGMAQVRAALVRILHKYKVEPVDEYNVITDPYSVIISPKDGGAVRFVPRN